MTVTQAIQNNAHSKRCVRMSMCSVSCRISHHSSVFFFFFSICQGEKFEMISNKFSIEIERHHLFQLTLRRPRKRKLFIDYCEKEKILFNHCKVYSQNPILMDRIYSKWFWKKNRHKSWNLSNFMDVSAFLLLSIWKPNEIKWIEFFFSCSFYRQSVEPCWSVLCAYNRTF